MTKHTKMLTHSIKGIKRLELSFLKYLRIYQL
nr:MAG TPA: hypothetical protein [Caudoviricetes sp.]